MSVWSIVRWFEKRHNELSKTNTSTCWKDTVSLAGEEVLTVCRKMLGGVLWPTPLWRFLPFRQLVCRWRVSWGKVGLSSRGLQTVDDMRGDWQRDRDDSFSSLSKVAPGLCPHLGPSGASSRRPCVHVASVFQFFQFFSGASVPSLPLWQTAAEP